jgi:hypothetical protein
VGGPELHEVRKTAKRASYAAEAAAASVGPPAHALARRMEDLQEVLGRHQDSLMARALLRDLAARMPEREAFALGRLIGMEHASDESLLAEYDVALAAASADGVRDWTRGWIATSRFLTLRVLPAPVPGSGERGGVLPHREHLDHALGQPEREPRTSNPCLLYCGTVAGWLVLR